MLNFWQTQIANLENNHPSINSQLCLDTKINWWSHDGLKQLCPSTREKLQSASKENSCQVHKCCKVASIISNELHFVITENPTIVPLQTARWVVLPCILVYVDLACSRVSFHISSQNVQCSCCADTPSQKQHLLLWANASADQLFCTKSCSPQEYKDENFVHGWQQIQNPRTK